MISCRQNPTLILVTNPTLITRVRRELFRINEIFEFNFFNSLEWDRQQLRKTLPER